MALTASTVSRKLRAAGFGVVTTYLREGIRVQRRGARSSGVAYVVVDLDRKGEADRLADTLEEFMTGAGWTYVREGVHFVVTETP